MAGLPCHHLSTNKQSVAAAEYDTMASCVCRQSWRRSRYTGDTMAHQPTQLAFRSRSRPLKIAWVARKMIARHWNASSSTPRTTIFTMGLGRRGALRSTMRSLYQSSRSPIRWRCLCRHFGTPVLDMLLRRAGFLKSDFFSLTNHLRVYAWTSSS